MKTHKTSPDSSLWYQNLLEQAGNWEGETIMTNSQPRGGKWKTLRAGLSIENVRSLLGSPKRAQYKAVGIEPHTIQLSWDYARKKASKARFLIFELESSPVEQEGKLVH